MLESIIAAIDKEIASLQQARILLAGTSPISAINGPRRGRPKGSKKAATPVKAKRVMSEEGRARVSAAMTGAPRELFPESRWIGPGRTSATCMARS